MWVLRLKYLRANEDKHCSSHNIMRVLIRQKFLRLCMFPPDEKRRAFLLSFYAENTHWNWDGLFYTSCLSWKIRFWDLMSILLKTCNNGRKKIRDTKTTSKETNFSSNTTRKGRIIIIPYYSQFYVVWENTWSYCSQISKCFFIAT